jgi:hypothetical protein
MFGQVLPTGVEQLRHAAEAGPHQRLLAQVPEKAFHQVEPGRTGGGKMQVEARVTPQPGFDLGVFVGGVVVDDGVQVDPGGRLGLDLL